MPLPPILNVVVLTANLGNTEPTKLSPLIAAGGGTADIVVFGFQESTYKPQKAKRKPPSDTAAGVEVTDAEGNAVDDKSAVKALLSRADDDDGGDGAEDEKTDAPSEPSDPAAVLAAVTDAAAQLNDMLDAHLGDKYEVVAGVQRMQMKLRVYIKKSYKEYVSDVEVKSENTGIGRLIANKGGQCVRFNLAYTSFCFVNCHLNAHEGHAKCALRNSDCREIFSGVQQGSAMMGRSTDMFQRYHHVFLCGDLNYRLDLGSGAKVAASQKKVAQMAAAGQFSDLWRYDELLREMDAGRTMAGFQTGKCAFPPTYKVARQAGTEYKATRVPSYTDRVLWKSLPGFKGNVTLDDYTSCPAFATSDHKPVRAKFTLMLTPQVEEVAAPPPGLAMPTFVFTMLSGRGFRAMDPAFTGGKADPYLKFSVEPPNLLLADKGSGSKLKTSIRPRTLAPKWTGEEVRVAVAAADAKSLESGGHVVIDVIDHDTLSMDDLMGTVVLSMADIVDGIDESGAFFFQAPVVKYGRTHGVVAGAVEFLVPEGGKLPKRVFRPRAQTRAKKAEGCGCVVA